MATIFTSTAAAAVATTSNFQNNVHFFFPHLKISPPSVSLSNPRNLRLPICRAAAGKQQAGGPVKKRPTPAAGENKKKRKKKSSGGGGGGGGDNTKGLTLSDVEIVDNFDDGGDGYESSSGLSESSQSYHPLPLPKPPAGFVVDDQGKVLMASTKRIATIVDSTNNYPLECVIRRVFRSSRGDECMLLCPVDTPVQILKSTNIDGWSAVSDEEVEAILPAAAYALAKIHMHLVYSGFCFTARGGFCYSEDDIFDFRTDNGQDVDGLPTEGVEITCFHLEGAHYMIYTPSDPLLFVVVKDKNGLLQIADDDLLEDPAIISAIDEETEFNALVEEEAALLESLLGER